MNVLFVDDEYAMLAIMKRAIDWEGIGVQNLFTASNVPSAKEILSQRQIDILICDIEMPKESGLDLIRWVREKEMNMECIILTAYPDFNYAKEAISLSTSSYLLKPVRFDELRQTLLDCMDRILRKQADEKYKRLGTSILSDTKKNEKRLLKQLIWEEIPVSAIEEEIRKYALDSKKFQHVDMSLFHCNNMKHLLDKNGKILLFALENAMDDLMENSINICVEYSPLVLSKSEEREKVEEQCQTYMKTIKKFMGCEMTAFVIQNIRLEEISAKFDSLHDMAETSLYREGQVTFLKEEDSEILQKDLIFDRIKWKNLFQMKSLELIKKQVQAETAKAEEQKILTKEYLKLYQQELLRLFYHASDVKNDSFITATDIEEFEHASNSVEEMVRWIFGMAERLYKNQKTAGEVSDVEKVRLYLEEHYSEPINRDEIEKYMHLNRDYLNRVFKLSTGYSLMEYVQNYRILSARKMLAESDATISEICLSVGYDSPPYFSKIFKKITGVTPVEYRNQNMH